MGLPAVALAGALLFALWPLAIWIEVDLRLEKPRYNITLSLPRGVELRTYEVLLLPCARECIGVREKRSEQASAGVVSCLWSVLLTATLHAGQAYTVASAQVQGDTLRGSVSRGFIEVSYLVRTAPSHLQGAMCGHLPRFLRD